MEDNKEVIKSELVIVNINVRVHIYRRYAFLSSIIISIFYQSIPNLSVRVPIGTHPPGMSSRKQFRNRLRGA